MKKMQKGFTLVELIVVITILAILGTIAFISLQGYSQDARNSKITSDVRNLTSAIETGTTDGTIQLANIVDGTTNTNNTLGALTYGSGKTLSTTNRAGTGTGVLYNVGDINLVALRQSATDFNYEDSLAAGGTTERNYLAGVLIDSDANNGKGYLVYQVAGQLPDPAGGKTAVVKGNWYTLDTSSVLTGLIAADPNTGFGVVDGTNIGTRGLFDN